MIKSKYKSNILIKNNKKLHLVAVINCSYKFLTFSNSFPSLKIYLLIDYIYINVINTPS